MRSIQHKKIEARMFNESILAHSLIDVYERLKEHKKKSGQRALALLHRMQEHYKDFHQIRSQIGQIGLKSSLWWTCIRLEESMWESIRIFQQEYGYETVPCLFDETLITFDSMEYPIPVRPGHHTEDERQLGQRNLLRHTESFSGKRGILL